MKIILYLCHRIMTTILLILAVLLAIVGVIGSIVPALPGPPISWAALLLAYLALDGAISMPLLFVLLAVVVAVTVLDYFAPALMTRLGGGSKAAGRGATIGTFVGLLVGPWGLLLGPLVGAFIGEWMDSAHRQNRGTHSLRVALLSFVGFLLTTGIKLITCLWIFYLIVAPIIVMLFKA